MTINGDTFPEFDALIAEVPGADHPYWTAGAVTGWLVSSEAMVSSALAGELYLLWSELGDWYDMREQAEALDAIRRAAAEWPDVKDNPLARESYFNKWHSAIRRAFETLPSNSDIAPPTALGPIDGEVVEYDEAAGVGFIRPDAGGPTYFFRWDDIKVDAFLKTLPVGARVRFEGYASSAGERFACIVSPLA